MKKQWENSKKQKQGEPQPHKNKTMGTKPRQFVPKNNNGNLKKLWEEKTMITRRYNGNSQEKTMGTQKTMSTKNGYSKKKKTKKKTKKQWDPKERMRTRNNNKK